MSCASVRSWVVADPGRAHRPQPHRDHLSHTADDLTATLAQARDPRRVLRVGALSTLSRNFLIKFVMSLIGRQDVEGVIRSGTRADLMLGLQALTLDIALTNLVPARDAASRPIWCDSCPSNRSAS